VGFIKSRQTKSKVAPIAFDLDPSNPYFEFELLATLVRDVAAWLSGQDLVSTGMRGTDVLGIGSMMSSIKSSVIVEEESMCIGLAADTAGPLAYDWKILVEMFEGQHDKHRRVIISTPSYLTRDDKLENEDAYVGVRDLLSEHLLSGHSFKSGQSPTEPEVAVTMRALEEPRPSGALELLHDLDVTRGITGHLTLRLEGRSPNDVIAFFGRQAPYPQASAEAGSGRSFLLGTSQRDLMRVELHAEGPDTVIDVDVSIAPPDHPVEAGIAACQARGIVTILRLWAGEKVTQMSGAPWLGGSL
jgi:hypothetical protein